MAEAKTSEGRNGLTTGEAAGELATGEAAGPSEFVVFARSAWTTAAKDLLLEWRTKSISCIFVLYALMTLVTLTFAFPAARAAQPEMGIGALWISVLFGSLLSLGRSFSLELELGALTAVRLSPQPPMALFVGKLLANFLIYAVLEVVLVLAFVIFYGQALDLRVLQLLGTLWLGTFGLCCVSTLLVAVTALVNGHQLLLPLMVLPLSLPLLIAAVKCSAGLYAPGMQAGWASLNFLVVYAVLFLAAATVLFDYVMEE